jgi:hypothetical protein
MDSISIIDPRITLEFLQTEIEGQYFERKGFDVEIPKPSKIANELI